MENLTEFSNRGTLPCGKGTSAPFSEGSSTPAGGVASRARSPWVSLLVPNSILCRLLVSGGGLVLLWGVLQLLIHVGYTCPIRALLHVPCPGCGMTRALEAALHLQFAQAWRAHPLYPLLLGYGVWLLVSYWRRGFRRFPWRWWAGSLTLFLALVWLLRLAGLLPWA